MTCVREFHEAFGLPAPEGPPVRPDPDVVRLRARLIREEYKEVMQELRLLSRTDDPKQVTLALRRLLKELADLRYVTEGTAVSFGLPIDAAYSEVHRSNMSKLGEDGKPIYREDGKVMKGPFYEEPDIAPFVPHTIDVKAVPDELGS